MHNLHCDWTERSDIRRLRDCKKCFFLALLSSQKKKEIIGSRVSLLFFFKLNQEVDVDVDVDVDNPVRAYLKSKAQVLFNM